MNSTIVLEEEQELARCEAEVLELERKLAEAREAPKKIVEEWKERENTMPPFERLAELRRILDHENGIASRREARNLQLAQNKSVLLILGLVAATAALIAWGFRLMNGM